MSEDKLSEVVLPRRVHGQPTPEINRGGDCGACVFGGLFGLSIERAYDEFHQGRSTIEYGEMARMLRVAESHGLADRIIEEPARFAANRGGGKQPFGDAAWLSAHAWHRYVQAMVDAGYYGIAQVDLEKRGLDGDGTNHWVLICGSRIGIKWEGRAGHFVKDVLVSCSARRSGGEVEWVDATDFLRYRGGYNLLFARPVAGS